MNNKPADAKDGREAASGLHKEARKEERKVEEQKGSDLKKGADRFEERAMSSDRRGEN